MENKTTSAYTGRVTIEKIKRGEVWLIGAGPGDPGLLTLHAANALGAADVVVHDELINPDILQLTGAHCELIYAGKRGGKPSANQRDISLQLVELARKNRKVVRLKGGDPFVFGRGGEEALMLWQHNIPFKVVPSVTSGIAGPAYAGIPITHREYNSVVSFVTGHQAVDAKSCRVNWQALVQTGGVIVFYMTLNRLNQVAEQLLKHGMNPESQVALISNATTALQSVVETSLGQCRHIDQAKIPRPCLIVVGDNVNLRQQLRWFD